MPHHPSKRLMISALIVLLHLPLVYHARSLYAALAPGQGLADLAPTALLLMATLFALPYGVLAVSGVRWNPGRARLNEPDA